MINYVAGFLLDLRSERVALIQKNKGPPKVVGRLNAIGGKVDPGETKLLAMHREFYEETGLDTTAIEWRPFLELKHGFAWTVFFFVAKSEFVRNVKTVEKELVGLYNVADLNTLNVVPNVRWILPMALSLDRGESNRIFTVLENG